MTERLLEVKTLSTRGQDSGGQIYLSVDVIDALGGAGTEVAIVEEEGKVYLVPTTEVSLL